MKPIIYLFCDESFEKLHTNKAIVLGVTAGVMIPDYFITKYQVLLSEFDKKYQLLINPKGKLHLANLPMDIRNEIQNEILHLLSNENVVCVYDAINVIRYNQFRQQYFNDDAAYQELKNRGLFIETVDTNKPNDDVIYELFYSMILKGLDYCNRHILHPAYIVNVVSDRIDGREDNYNRVLRKIQRPGIESEFTFNNSVKKEKSKSRITIKSDLITNKEFELELFTSMEGSNLFVFCADVLANALLNHLRIRKDGYNIPDAISNHPLLSKLNINHHDMSDRFYNNQIC